MWELWVHVDSDHKLFEFKCKQPATKMSSDFLTKACRQNLPKASFMHQ